MSGLLLALALGLRHGVDPDHLAAISDIASVREKIGRTLRESFSYAIGHAVVVLVFVSVTTVVGGSMPAWFATTSSVLVGATLIGLGLWVLLGVVTNDPKPRSRYRLISHLVNRASWRRAEVVRVEHEHDHGPGHHGEVPPFAPQAGSLLTGRRHKHAHVGWLPGTPAPFVVGMAHGFGAETPTQIALLSAAAGSAAFTAVTLGVAFVIGLVVSNMAVATLASLSMSGAARWSWLSKGLSIVAGVMSVWMGAATLF